MKIDAYSIAVVVLVYIAVMGLYIFFLKKYEEAKKNYKTSIKLIENGQAVEDTTLKILSDEEEKFRKVSKWYPFVIVIMTVIAITLMIYS